MQATMFRAPDQLDPDLMPTPETVAAELLAGVRTGADLQVMFANVEFQFGPEFADDVFAAFTGMTV